MSNSKATKDTEKTVEKEKKNAIKWGPDNIQTFLETFQNYELLWNVRHDDYSNKAKRESSILKLKEDLISQGLVVPDVAFLRARIKAIKTTYRSELIKVLSSKTSGSGADDVYTPKLPWFQTADTFLNSVVVTRESQSNLTLINTAYCTLILLGKFIQRLVFGELRVSEQQHLKDKFWNFVFYKFIFVFGVINVQYMDEVVMWCAWFSVLGSLHLLAQLCKDRFEYLSFSPTTPGWSHLRLVVLLVAILFLSGLMFLVCAAVGFLSAGLNTFAFMAAECVLLSVRTLHTLLRYALHVYDVRGGGGRVWEKRGALAYYTELVFELGALLIELLHHMHMLLWSNIFLSMASLVICMHLRYLIHEIQRRVKKHRNYLWVLYHMEQSYPMASSKELAENSDNCAICWEKMESARKLPCTHLFHNSCLQSWLEQDTSCPTCRLALSIHSLASASSQLNESANLPPNRPRPNHFFHFDGSRYVSWLPSFSVEVTHAQLLHTTQPTHTSQLDAMARTVQQLFPHLPLNVIIDDLHITRSVELTVENVLEGHVQAPLQSPPPSPPASTATSPPPPPLIWQHTTSRYRHNGESAEEDDEPLNPGSRFSKSPSERERILHVRKEKLLLGARRRYLERHPPAS